MEIFGFLLSSRGCRVAENEKPKKKRRRGNTLEKWEVAIVKAMIVHGSPFTNDQDSRAPTCRLSL